MGSSQTEAGEFIDLATAAEILTTGNAADTTWKDVLRRSLSHDGMSLYWKLDGVPARYCRLGVAVVNGSLVADDESSPRRVELNGFYRLTKEVDSELALYLTDLMLDPAGSISECHAAVTRHMSHEIWVQDSACRSWILLDPAGRGGPVPLPAASLLRVKRSHVAPTPLKPRDCADEIQRALDEPIDFSYWAAMPRWTLLQAVLLLLGYEPLKVDATVLELVEQLSQHHDDMMEVFARFQKSHMLVTAAHAADIFENSSEAFEGAGASPRKILDWCEQSNVNMPERLRMAVVERAPGPSRDELVARAAQLELQIEALGKNSVSCSGSEKEKLLITIGALALALSRSHPDCRQGEGKPNKSGLLRQAEQHLPTGCGYEKTQFSKVLSDAFSLINKK